MSTETTPEMLDRLEREHVSSNYLPQYGPPICLWCGWNTPYPCSVARVVAHARSLEAALEDMTWQHAYRTRDGMKLCTGGLSSNEHAFDVLGWNDPHDITAEMAALGEAQ